MALYSLIQLIAFILLIYRNTDLSPMQYLYQDSLIMLPSIIIMSWQIQNKKLTKRFPKPRFLYGENIVSILVQLILQIASIFTVSKFIQYLDGYTSTNIDSDGVSLYTPNYDNTAHFLISSFGMVVEIIVCNIEQAFRLPFYKNVVFLIWVGLSLLCVLLLLFLMDSRVAEVTMVLL